MADDDGGSPVSSAARAGGQAPEPSDRAVVAKFFRGLGDPTRLALVELLLEGELSVSECVASVGVAQSRVSDHLACLSRCGYVSSRREGRFVYYRVTDPRVAGLVALARSMVTDNSDALANCATIDEHDAS